MVGQRYNTHLTYTHCHNRNKDLGCDAGISLADKIIEHAQSSTVETHALSQRSALALSNTEEDRRQCQQTLAHQGLARMPVRSIVWYDIMVYRSRRTFEEVLNNVRHIQRIAGRQRRHVYLREV